VDIFKLYHPSLRKHKIINLTLLLRGKDKRKNKQDSNFRGSSASKSVSENLCVQTKPCKFFPSVTSFKVFQKVIVPCVSKKMERSNSQPEDEIDDEGNMNNEIGLSHDQKRALISAMISNFSTSFNVMNISVVLPILQDLYQGTSEDEAACASSLLGGMMLGQLIGGILGDSFLGRLGALKLVMFIQFIASLGSALIWNKDVYIWLAVWRFILGIGAGAVYPLAATLSSEQAHATSLNNDLSSKEKIQQLRSVVWTFSMQGVGFLTVPLIAVPLLYFTSETSLDIVWRILLGIGCIPGLLLAVLQMTCYYKSDIEAIPQTEPEPSDVLEEIITEERREPLIIHEDEDVRINTVPIHNSDHSLFNLIVNEPNLLQKLLGTAGTWFFFDILFYGNTLFQPIVMEAAFGGDKQKDEVIKKAARDSLILSLIALPGYGVSALIIGKRVLYILQTPRYVQTQGFVVMGLLYSIIGAYWYELQQIPSLLVFIYGLTFFFANYGPNTTTFVFPSLIFSKECRSTLNGVCAASGKLGALMGAMLFAPTASAIGDNYVMLICAAICMIAFGLTKLFTDINFNEDLQLIE
jgi:MFS transporter, PHS family, inorganic phosphate transporter